MEIVYIPGGAKIVADTLSRLDVMTLPTDVDTDELVTEQGKANKLREFIANSSRSYLAHQHWK